MNPIITLHRKKFRQWFLDEYNDGDDSEYRVIRLPIVGGIKHGVVPHKILAPLKVVMEESNPFDNTALAIMEGQTSLGYITRDKKHHILDTKIWFQDDNWSHLPKLVSTEDDTSALYFISSEQDY